MRTIRALTAAAVMAGVLPGLLSAQQSRQQFRDSWFWGAKAGGLLYADSSGSYAVSPTIGFDWMITRTYGGLYIAGSQSYFTAQTIFASNPQSPDSNFRAIDMRNLRRVDFAAVGFPGRHVKWHPYVAAGFSLQQIPTAQGRGPFNTQTEFDATRALIQDTRVSVTPMLMAGAQYRMRYASTFGQFMIAPIQKNFLLYNGRTIGAMFEIGVRYNLGSSIDNDP